MKKTLFLLLSTFIPYACFASYAWKTLIINNLPYTVKLLRLDYNCMRTPGNHVYIISTKSQQSIAYKDSNSTFHRDSYAIHKGIRNCTDHEKYVLYKAIQSTTNKVLARIRLKHFRSKDDAQHWVNSVWSSHSNIKIRAYCGNNSSLECHQSRDGVRSDHVHTIFLNPHNS